MGISIIKENIDGYSMEDISHFWKLSKVYMEKASKNSEEFQQLQSFQNYLGKRIKQIRRSRKI